MLMLHSGAIATKQTKDTLGVNVFSLKKNAVISRVREYTDGTVVDANRYRVKTLPSAGTVISQKDLGEQLKLF